MPHFLRRIFSDRPFWKDAAKDRSTEDDVLPTRRVITRTMSDRPDEYARWRYSDFYLSENLEESLAFRDAVSVASSDKRHSLQPVSSQQPLGDFAPLRKRSTRRRLSKRHRMPPPA